MVALLDIQLQSGPTAPVRRRRRPIQRTAPSESDVPVHARFAVAQAINTARNAAALRPFRLDEFGTTPPSPSTAHVQAANQLIAHLRQGLLSISGEVRRAADRGIDRPSAANMQQMLLHKERAIRWTKLVEQIWDYYLELFNQRQTRVGNWLLAADRIALDCYQATYTGLGKARSIPAPPPLSYMETGFTPSTFRRGVSLRRLGRRANPFPIVQLPYHRLVNPWTLGAIHHEVSHNIQSDLGMWREVPRRINLRLRRNGLPPEVASVWTRWHKEMFADLCGLLLGGPAIVASLLDVVARTPRTTKRFNPRGVHPTPYLRPFINLELLQRMGFRSEARRYRHFWSQLYPAPERSNIPRSLLQTFPQANQIVVDTICYQPYAQLGGKSLAEVVHFEQSHQQMVKEAGQRIATGTDPGIVPARFLVGAARWALDNQLARPGRITANFYQALIKR
jgi:hypothetical protein